MKQWRKELLRENKIDLYQQIQEFFLMPSNNKANAIAQQFSVEKREPLLNDMRELIELYGKDRIQYNKLITEGQAVIWNEVLRCYLDVRDIARRFDQYNCKLVGDSYSSASSELTTLCDFYARMLARVSSLEKVLGADRFLDRINSEAFLIIDEVISEYRKKLNYITSSHKVRYQEEWNTTSVSKVILHKLKSQDTSNPICNMFHCNQDHVMLFVIDGFGFCQYLWHSHLGEEKRSYTYNESLFRWLTQENCLRSYPLGSSYITDTAAGLAQICIGKGSATTGIIASKFHDSRTSSQFTDTKRINPQEFHRTFDASWNSIFDVLTVYGVETRLYYCSKYPNTPSGFSKYIFGSANVLEIVPQERVFAVLNDEINEGFLSGLQVVYMSGIDNTGHTMGAYSNFERYEHDKLNGLLRNFLIELADTRAELFNGKRSILITADHGMSESSKLMIDRFSIKRAITESGDTNAVIIEDNRALLIYNISRTRIDIVKQTLEKYFEAMEVWVDIATELESGFREFFCVDSNHKHSYITPQIVVRLIGDGLFYSNMNINSHLLHYGGHGGASVDEVFVPMVEIPLNDRLLSRLKTRFINM